MCATTSASSLHRRRWSPTTWCCGRVLIATSIWYILRMTFEGDPHRRSTASVAGGRGEIFQRNYPRIPGGERRLGPEVHPLSSDPMFQIKLLETEPPVLRNLILLPCWKASSSCGFTPPRSLMGRRNKMTILRRTFRPTSSATGRCLNFGYIVINQIKDREPPVGLNGTGRRRWSPQGASCDQGHARDACRAGAAPGMSA